MPDLKGAKFLGPKDRDYSSFKVSKKNLMLLLELWWAELLEELFERLKFLAEFFLDQ